MATTIYDIDCTDLRGNSLPLRQFAGRPILVINTASFCGFSKQYDAIEAVWQRFQQQGLVVLGIPTNDFGRQEPGNSAEIAALCKTKFGISFQMLEKATSSGPNAHPVFKLIEQEGGFWAKPKWNFYKYIFGKDGHLVDWFSSFTTPKSPRFNHAISKVMS